MQILLWVTLFIYLAAAMTFLVSHFLFGPAAIAKHGKRSLRETYLEFGNIFYVYANLKEIEISTGDKEVQRLRKIIKISFLTLIVSFALFVVVGKSTQ